MPPSVITILDWGQPGAPMVIQRDATTLRLGIPDRPTAWHAACVAYATRELSAPPHLSPGPKSVDLGFYGYLRVCNALCLEKTGVSIFDLADAPWRDWYVDQTPPHEAVDQLLADNDYPSSEDV
jgi:hypothetical protein